MWFVKINKTMNFNNKEIPLDSDDLGSLIPSSVPENPFQALMETAPGGNVPLSQEELLDFKDAVIDCIDMLSEQDRYIVDAITYERVTYAELASRLGVSSVHAWRLYQGALKNLKQIMSMHSVFQERFDFE
jgi:DNA-directed RNA polymerase specialized sigma24 family protein